MRGIALGVLAVAAGMFAMVRRPPSGHRPPQPRHADDHRGRSAAYGDEPAAQEQSSRPARQSSERRHDARERERDARDAEHQRAERRFWALGLLVSVAATVATAFAAWFAYKAYDAAMGAVAESRKQVEAALEANRISRQAFDAANGSSVHFTQAEFRSGTDARGAFVVNVRIPLGNDGGTATRGLRYRGVCATRTDKPADPFERAKLAAERSYSITLAPKQTTRPVVCTLGVPELARIEATGADLYVYGEATYRDTADPAEAHRVEFCTRLRGLRVSGSPLDPGPNAIGEECERHNCRDEECAAQDAAPPPPGRAEPTGL